MQLSGQSNELIDPAALQALSIMHSDQGPVFSLYLDLRSPGPIDRFQNLLRQMEQQKKLDQAPAADREQWAQEAQRIGNSLEKERPPQGRGLVMFSSLAAGLWQVFILPVPVLDRLVVSDRPYVRQLDILLGEFNCTLIVLIDAAQARLVKVFLGRAEEMGQLPVTAGAEKGDLRGGYVRSVLERAQAVWEEQNCDRLVIGGSYETLSELRDSLPVPMRASLAGETSLSSQVGLEELLAQVQALESEQERNIEAQRVKELMANIGNGDAVVTGLEQTLLAVRSKKVRLLMVEEDFRQAGGECPNCGFLSEGEEGICLICEMALRPEPDIIEAALKRVLDAGREIEILRSQEARQALEPYGRIGALLQDPSIPPEKDLAHKLTTTKEGKVNPDVLHDEAIDESFPASDPPSWTH